MSECASPKREANGREQHSPHFDGLQKSDAYHSVQLRGEISTLQPLSYVNYRRVYICMCIRRNFVLSEQFWELTWCLITQICIMCFWPDLLFQIEIIPSLPHVGQGCATDKISHDVSRLRNVEAPSHEWGLSTSQDASVSCIVAHDNPRSLS